LNLLLVKQVHYLGNLNMELHFLGISLFKLIIELKI
jgi:hypothetical protein